MYDGGSHKDKLLSSLTGNLTILYGNPITSLRNQMFIKFSSDGNGIGKGFTAKITFGNKVTTHWFIWK